MNDTGLGFWLRRERERRGITLRTIADQTKVAAPLLEGLENDDLSRWPGGIYRRAFVKAYATALGLDADDVVKRFEREHPAEEPAASAEAVAGATSPAGEGQSAGGAAVVPPLPLAVSPIRSRVRGTAADLTVALILGLGSAAAESRLLWPVLLIAAYYAVGILLTGTSPMVALLSEPAPAQPAPSADESAPEVAEVRPVVERRRAPRRAGGRPARAAGSRQPRPRVQ